MELFPFPKLKSLTIPLKLVNLLKSDDIIYSTIRYHLISRCELQSSLSFSIPSSCLTELDNAHSSNVFSSFPLNQMMAIPAD